MAGYHQAVDDIRAFVQATDQTRSPALEALAGSYAEACAEAARRLGQCQRLLQQGLRSEAIQLAEADPRLLDLVAALDFPERDAWDELVGIYGLPAAPRVSQSAAQFLNEAYALEEPLQDLLRTHRRLALSRAPVRARIAVMRKLAAQDPTNPIWPEDLRVFEKVRFRELQEDGAEAARRREVKDLGKILAEVEESPWVEPPPKALVQGLRKADAQLRGQQNRAALADLEGELADAFAARDPERARRARQPWLSLVGVLGLAEDDPAMRRARPILDWLEDRDRADEDDRRHEDAIRELRQTLDEPGAIAPADLERLGNTLLRHERGMPESLQARYVQRLAAERARANRLRMIVGGSAAAAVLLVLGLIAASVRSTARAQEAERAAQAVSDAVELGELARAGDLLKKLEQDDPAILQQAPMLEAREMFKGAEGREAQRQLAFEQAYRAAEASPLGGASKPMDEARKLAVQPTEKEAVAKLAERRAAALEAERKRQGGEARPRIRDLGDRVAALRASLAGAKAEPAKARAAEDEFEQLRGEADALAAATELADGEVKTLAQAARLDVENLGKQLESGRRVAAVERDMAATLRSAGADEAQAMSRYLELLKKAAEAEPGSPRARALPQLDREAQAWEAVAAWNRLLAAWAKEPAGGGPRRDQERLDLCNRLIAKYPQSPDAAEIAACRDRLQAVARRAEPLAGRLQQLLSDPLVGSVWMVKVRPPNRDEPARKYYLAQRPPDDSSVVHYYKSYNTEKPAMAAIVREHIALSEAAPQSRIAARYKAALGQLARGGEWDGPMMDLAAAIRQEPEIDPLLQLNLLRRVLELAGDGSVPLREACRDALARIDQAGVDVTVPWMDPDNADARRLRPAAAEAVASLPDFAEIRKHAREIAAGLDGRLARRPHPVGWLSPGPQGWRVEPAISAADAGDGELLVAAREEGGAAAWKRVGTVARGVASLRAEDASAMVEGRPVYFRPAAAERP
ncbi:hypothetical protein OJF2_00070 [Aquisphaera giovannonii]|uniref:Uncharacterized protein n=1 Tax=Aquisphaera giovannonii TaxID=406548 RepID=A0A5B9VTC3_9BACT|nr:hypothetical protein [Aquisphaera giovannonii]QEH31542.1 hypothetical protein OJF2_00070 [Aquisphaera giovannonii]